MAMGVDIFLMVIFMILVVLLAGLIERLYRENEVLRADQARALVRQKELTRRLEAVERLHELMRVV